MTEARYVTVQAKTGLKSSDWMSQTVCQDCGAVVHDTAAHDRWHDFLVANLELPSLGTE